MQIKLTKMFFVYLFFSAAVLSAVQTDLISEGVKVTKMQVNSLLEALKVLKSINSSSTNSGSSFKLLKKILTILPIKGVISLGVLWGLYKKFGIEKSLEKYLKKLIKKVANQIILKNINSLFQNFIAKLLKNNSDSNEKSWLRETIRDSFFDKKDNVVKEQYPKSQVKQTNNLLVKEIDDDKIKEQFLGPDSSASEPVIDDKAEGASVVVEENAVKEKNQSIDESLINEFLSASDKSALPREASESTVVASSSDSGDDNGDSSPKIKNYLSSTVTVSADPFPHVVAVFSDPVTEADSSVQPVVSEVSVTEIDKQTVGTVPRVERVTRLLAHREEAKQLNCSKGNLTSDDYDDGVDSIRTTAVQTRLPLSLATKFSEQEEKTSSSQKENNWKSQFIRTETVLDKDEKSNLTVSSHNNEMEQAWNETSSFGEVDTDGPLFTRLSGPIIPEEDDLLAQRSFSKEEDYDDHCDAKIKPISCSKNKILFQMIRHFPEFNKLVLKDRVKLTSSL